MRHVAVCITILCASSSSFAYSQFMGAIPHGTTLRCVACHERAAGGEGWNAFGQDILIAGGAQPEVNTSDQNDGFDLDNSDFWPAVCRDDSDDDGATNGEELGDPGCAWTIGDPNPADIDPSLPGDPDDVPGPSGEGEGEGEGEGQEGEGEGEGDDTDADADIGGCASTGQHVPALGMLAALTLLTRRRRR